MRRTYLFLLAALVLAGLISPMASPLPDGLERVAEDHGFLTRAEGKEIVKSPIPDYSFPGVKNEAVATSLAGLLGTVCMFVCAYLLGLVVSGGKGGHGNSSPRE